MNREPVVGFDKAINDIDVYILKTHYGNIVKLTEKEVE